MADVFLSYSSKDRAVATHVERALSAAGYDVFWDQETPTGRDWNTWIGEKLAEIAALRGSPPKIIWLRCGNHPTQVVEGLLRHHAACLELY